MSLLRRLVPMLIVALPVQANPAPALQVELNQTEQQGAACRMVFVAENSGEITVEQLVLEAVLFDTAGRVAMMTLFDLQELPAGRTRVRSFDLAGRDCADLSRVLINGVSACTGEGLDPAHCAAALDVRSRTDLEVLQ